MCGLNLPTMLLKTRKIKCVETLAFPRSSGNCQISETEVKNRCVCVCVCVCVSVCGGGGTGAALLIKKSIHIALKFHSHICL